MKKREYPLRAVLDETLLKRLPPNHPKRPLIEEDLRKYCSGYRGEQSLDYYLQFLPDDDYHILQSLRLTFQDISFQIDFLLLTNQFALIIEAKNYKSELRFDKNFDQLTQTHQEKEKVYENPISQAKRQRALLIKWLQANTSITIPVDFLVVMTHPNSLLKTDPGNVEVLKKVCKPHKLIDKIHILEKQYPKTITDKKTLKKLSKLLLKRHTPKQINNILEIYKIMKKEIVTGVFCPQCGFIPMEHRPRKWTCTVCKTSSQNPYMDAVGDYFLLMGNSITNADLRKFLHLPSTNAAQKILAKLNLTSTGQTKGKIYFKAGERHEFLTR